MKELSQCTACCRKLITLFWRISYEEPKKPCQLQHALYFSELKAINSEVDLTTTLLVIISIDLFRSSSNGLKFKKADWSNLDKYFPELCSQVRHELSRLHKHTKSSLRNYACSDLSLCERLGTLYYANYLLHYLNCSAVLSFHRLGCCWAASFLTRRDTGSFSSCSKALLTVQLDPPDCLVPRRQG